VAECADSAMQAAVDRFAFHPSLRYGSVGVCVMRIDSGTVVAAHTPDEACITASTMKTVTSATALELLGKDFTFGTKVMAVGKIDRRGTLHGNVVVRGEGDPTLGSRYFAGHGSIVDSIVAKMHEHGIHKVTGRVIVDTSAVPYPPVGNCWMFDDLGYDYGAGCFGVCFADNVLRISLDCSGDEPTDIRVEPLTTQLAVNSRIKLYNHDEKMDVSYVEAVPDYDLPSLTLWGGARRDAKRFEQTFANPAPYYTLEDSVLRGLRHAEIQVKDKALQPEKIEGDTLVLVDFRSPLLPEVLSSLLYRSDNMFTEMTLRAVASIDGNQATIKNGVARVQELWKQKGVDCTPLFMRDGSGLSRNNKASARFLCEMLRRVYADRDSLGCDFSQLLPVGGVSGTLKSLLGKTPLCGKVALKSGSMSDVQCFTGYYPADKPEYTVTILVNNFVCTRAELRRNIEQLLVGLFWQGK
ncbi:MAG: D-alanyl-D-alanine carboxypeptidase/D-alanyl-D-alanine-endopeptidase, partial [Muribaculaceae bacterium]